MWDQIGQDETRRERETVRSEMGCVRPTLPYLVMPSDDRVLLPNRVYSRCFVYLISESNSLAFRIRT